MPAAAASTCAHPAQVFNNQSTAGPEDTSWRDSLYRIYSNSSTSMRVAVYGSKHDAGIYERLLREFCAVKPLVGCERPCVCAQRGCAELDVAARRCQPVWLRAPPRLTPHPVRVCCCLLTGLRL
jgi:hypothetical protein